MHFGEIMAFKSPLETAKAVQVTGTAKTLMPWDKLVLMGFLAGAYIAFGSLLALIVTAGMTRAGYPIGLYRFAFGAAPNANRYNPIGYPALVMPAVTISANKLPNAIYAPARNPMRTSLSHGISVFAVPVTCTALAVSKGLLNAIISPKCIKRVIYYIIVHTSANYKLIYSRRLQVRAYYNDHTSKPL